MFFVGFYWQLLATSDTTAPMLNSTATSCLNTTYLGRQFYFHVCKLYEKRVFDIRSFYQDRDQLKASIQGITLEEGEFRQVLDVGRRVLNRLYNAF